MTSPSLRPLLCLLFAVPLVAQEHSHPHDDAPTATAPVAAGPIRLTASVVQNLDLQTAEVGLQELEQFFPALGVVEPGPGKVAAVTSRVPGRVTRLFVQEGQTVAADELLLEVEARVAAETPPRLAFRAPWAGRVLATRVVTGDAVEPDRTLITVVDLTEIDVVAQVYEGQIAQLRPGQRVRIRPLAHPDTVLEGKVRQTAAGLDRATGTLRVFVQVENRAGLLLPGMRARLAFVTGRSETAVVVPHAAVLGEAGDYSVFRQVLTAPFTYERTPVVLGLRDDRFVEIVEGVLPGDRVVTRGSYQLQFSGGGAAKIEDDHGHAHGPGGHQH